MRATVTRCRCQTLGVVHKLWLTGIQARISHWPSGVWRSGGAGGCGAGGCGAGWSGCRGNPQEQGGCRGNGKIHCSQQRLLDSHRENEEKLRKSRMWEGGRKAI